VQENGGITKTFRLSIDNKLLDCTCSLHLRIRQFTVCPSVRLSVCLSSDGWWRWSPGKITKRSNIPPGNINASTLYCTQRKLLITHSKNLLQWWLAAVICRVIWSFVEFHAKCVVEWRVTTTGSRESVVALRLMELATKKYFERPLLRRKRSPVLASGW
jgi:hypothetical protein